MFNLVHMMKNNSSHKIAKYVKIRLKNSFLITLVLGDAKFTPDKKLNNRTKSKAYLQTLYLLFFISITLCCMTTVLFACDFDNIDKEIQKKKKTWSGNFQTTNSQTHKINRHIPFIITKL